MKPEALALSHELAQEMGQIRRVRPREFFVPSRTRDGLGHTVAWTLDGELICNCEAANLGKRECWAVDRVRKELTMMDTDTERALVPVQVASPQALLPTERTYALIDKAAQLALSGAVSLPKELNGREKVAAVMLYGWELGLRPMTSLQELYIVNGRVQPSARVMAGLLSARTDARLSVVESTDKKCTMRLVWPSRKVDETWTVEWAEIERAKLAGREIWQAYPRDKLITHCTKRILRIYAPDIINGLSGPAIDQYAPAEDDDDIDPAEMYNAGEARVIDHETGEIIEPQGAAPPEPEPAPPPVRRPTVGELMEQAKAVYTDLKQTTARPHLAETMRHIAETWPETVVEGPGGSRSLQLTRLAAGHVAPALEYLRSRRGDPPAEEPKQERMV